MPTSSRAPHRTAIVVIASLIASTLAMVDATSVGAQPQPGDTVTIYDDQLDTDFEDWSWTTTSPDLAATGRVAEGATSIRAVFGAWEGVFLANPNTLDVPLAGELVFSVHAGANPDAVLSVALADTSNAPGPVVEIRPPAGQWETYRIALEDLGGFAAIRGVWWQEWAGVAQSDAIHIDDIHIVVGETPPPAAGPTLTVDPNPRSITRTVTDPTSGEVFDHVIAFPHPISDDVYGMNFAPDELREETSLTLNRWGGNSTERYNHIAGTSNTGADWYFQNVADEVGGDHTFEDDNQADGTKSIITMPLSGWVTSAEVPACSYPVTDYHGSDAIVTPQDDTEVHGAAPEALVCGNGRRNGEIITGVDPTITSIPTDEAWVTDWVRELVATHGSAAEGGVEIYAMGNEPGLWYATHSDIAPDPIGRTELIDRNISYATAVKDADPTAAVIGPVLWSGYSYYVTTEEVLSGTFGGQVPTFVADYLAGLADAEAAAGTRLLDALAVNFYDDRVYAGGSDDLRLQATRSLWDPTYAPADWWVVRDFTLGEGQAVIPRLDSLIDANYPGTDLAITEYNFGGFDTLAGGLAQADALGIFGREGLDMATVWEPWADWVGMSLEDFVDRPGMWAFRLFRNYDGAGARFGDVSLYSSSTDEPTVSVHAAQRSDDGAVTMMVINKSTRDQEVTLETGDLSGTAEQWRYSGADLSAIVRHDDLMLNGSTAMTVPARSATLLVLDPDSQPTVTPTPGPTTEPDPTPTGEPTPQPSATPTPEPTTTPGPTPTPGRQREPRCRSRATAAHPSRQPQTAWESVMLTLQLPGATLGEVEY